MIKTERTEIRSHGVFMSGIGFLGEIDVMKELEHRGFAPYIPLKDKGIDFIAVNGSKFFQIQVKTSLFLKGSYFWFDLHRDKMIYSPNTYYVLVCKVLERRTMMGKSRNFIILPSMRLKSWIEKGDIVPKANNQNILNIFIYPYFEEQRFLYRNKGKELDLTEYRNNFSVFE